MPVWRDVTAGDGSIGPKWIPKPELKNYKVEIRLLMWWAVGDHVIV
jgi:hypothetical protein